MLREIGPDKYILEDKKVVVCDDLEKWSEFFGSENRTVDYTEIGTRYNVSTVFLGLTHGYGPFGPLLFETLVFGKGRFESAMFRYTSWDDAVIGHLAMVSRVRAESTWWSEALYAVTEPLKNLWYTMKWKYGALIKSKNLCLAALQDRDRGARVLNKLVNRLHNRKTIDDNSN